MSDIAVARTLHETQAFLSVATCVCGERGAAWMSADVTLPDGAAGTRWTGRCPGCGRERAYAFRKPPWSQDVPDVEDDVVFGSDNQVSQLLDPAEWILVAERNASTVPPDPERLQGAARKHAWDRLRVARAALYEALRFGDPDQPRIPDDAIRSDLGRRWLAEEPDRFERARIEAQRSAYDRAVRPLRPPRPPQPVHPERQARPAGPDLGKDPASRMPLDSSHGALGAYGMVEHIIRAEWQAEPAERDRKLALVGAVYKGWLARHRIDDSAWPTDDVLWPANVHDIPDELLPPADVAWELVRSARTVAGLDQSTGRRPI